MIKFAQFRRRFHTFRQGQCKELHKINELSELPVGAVAHILDNFQMNQGVVNFAPAFDNPITAMNNYKILVHHVTGMESLKEVVPVVRNRIRLTASGLISQLNAYRRDMKGRVLPYNSLADIPYRPNTIPLVNYNSIFRARVMGIRRKPRFINFLFAYILNTIMTVPEKMHYIHIPLESLRFEKSDFVRVFKKYDRISTKYPEISSYLFLAHFYGILCKPMSLPKRGQMDGEDEEEGAIEAFVDDPSTFDPDLTSEEFLTNVRAFIESDNLCATEELSLKDTENPYKKSIFEFIPAKVFENINFFLTCGENFIIYNLRDIKELVGHNGSGIMRIINHVNMLTGAGAPSQYVQTAEPESVAEEIVDVEEGGNKANQPEFVAPMTKKEKQDAADIDLKELDDFDAILSASLPQEERQLTTAQKEHARKISTSYKKLTIGGKSFEQVLTEVPDMDFGPPPELAKQEKKAQASQPKEAIINGTNEHIFAPSTTADLDAQYIDKLMNKDLAAIFTSFNKQGMFLVDFKQEDLIDELNSRTVFKVKYEDLSHKTHSFKLSLPKVDKNGCFLDNGSVKTIHKQRVSNPICKVKDDRVTLNSNYNKLLVTRNTNASHDFFTWFKKAIAKAGENGFKINLVHGSCKYPIKAFPYELTEIGSHYVSLTWKAQHGGALFFDIVNREHNIPEAVRKEVLKLEKESGVWFGWQGDEHYFITVTGQVSARNIKTNDEPFFGAFMDFVEYITGVEMNSMTEFAQCTIMSYDIPVAHMLCYRYGLTNMLKYCNVDYEIFDKNARVEKRTSDIVIQFSDKKLIIRRNPRVNALLFGGLSIYDLGNFSIEDMDDKDVYYDMLSQKGISPNMIKGIDGVFNLFIDPTTKDVLREMREPTDIRDLLIRAVAMLTTTEHKHPASASNFRFRGVEQITGMVYNELARAFAGYKNRSVGSSNKFSISEYAVAQRIMHHQLVENVSVINPIHDIKMYSKFSNAGDGGRSNDTFMIPDRQFTDDQLGIVSEATVDNGTTGLNASLPFNPIFTNARGMALTEEEIDKLEPENVLSITSLLVPGATQDDSKRANFINIQLSHYVPIVESEVSRLKTGYEGVVAQKCTNPSFAYSAQGEGTVQSVDEKTKTMIIRYKDGKKVCIPYGSEATNNSANGFFVDQEIEVNGFKAGDKFKPGDILVYNRQFFKANPYDKQVEWKMGILAKVAIMDNGGTVEDASIITRPLAEKMVFNPIHVKEIVITKDTNVHFFADIDTAVLNTEPVMVFDQSAIPFDTGDDPALRESLSKLNRQAPKAGHSGTIMKIDVLYKCPISQMSPTLQKLVRHVIKNKDDRAARAEGCENASQFRKSAPLAATTKVGTVDMTDETVILRFYIKQNKGMNPGDKLFFDSALKSTVSTVYDDYIMTEDGEKVEACTSGRGILARLICSPFTQGLCNSVLEKLENDILGMWKEA